MLMDPLSGHAQLSSLSLPAPGYASIERHLHSALVCEPRLCENPGLVCRNKHHLRLVNTVRYAAIKLNSRTIAYKEG